MQKKLKVERIDNGLIVSDGEDKRYYPDIEQMMESIKDELVERYLDARHFGWNGRFEVKVDVKGLP